MPSSRLQLLQQLQDHDLHRDVERRGRLVEDQQLAARPRSRGRCRPAPSGRPRAGAESASAARAAGRPCRPAPRRARVELGAATASCSRRSGSAMASERGEARVEAVAGILEHHLDARAGWRCRRRRCAGIAPMSAPSSRMLPAVGSSSRAIRRTRVDLPQPDSPTRPTRLAAADREAHLVDGVQQCACRRPSEALGRARRCRAASRHSGFQQATTWRSPTVRCRGSGSSQSSVTRSQRPL